MRGLFGIVVAGWALVATGAAMWFGLGGAWSAATWLDAGIGAAAAVMLWGTVSVPWDLYFGARAVARAQADGVARSVRVRPEEQAEAGALATRLLALAIGLPLVGAGVCAAASAATGGEVGWFASGAFVLAMLLRPAWAMVDHVRRRLKVLEGRARIPTVDAEQLHQQIGTLTSSVQALRRAVDHEDSGLQALAAKLVEAERRADAQARRHQADIDRVGLETERALEKLSRDQEVLSGLRAFLQMVRER